MEPLASVLSIAPRLATVRRKATLAMMSASAIGCADNAVAQTAPRTAAGSTISNAATATYEAAPGRSAIITSNTVSLRVDELLDVAVASRQGGDVAAPPGATDRVLAFTVTNAGNGSEAFALTATGAVAGDDFDPAVASIVLDSNGNGQYDAGLDQTYFAGGNDPVLAPDASATVFVLSSIDAAVADGGRGQVRLSAAAATGTGVAGTVFAGAGQGGGDAVAGATTASGSAGGFYRVAAAAVSLVKSADVADPFGGTEPVTGAVITYSIRAQTTGSGAVEGLAIRDAVPGGTSYRPGTIELDGAPLTDAADGDRGGFAAGQVAVALGTVPGGTTHVIRFKVRID